MSNRFIQSVRIVALTRRYSHCSNNDHNSRTCPNRGVKLFGVRLTDGSSIWKSVCMGNLNHYTGSNIAALQNGGNDSSGETPDHGGTVADGYASEEFVPDFVPGSSSSRERKVPLNVTTETPPERPGEPDCPYFIKTQRCKFGPRCKFNHPKDRARLAGLENVDASVLPERPSEPPCAFYTKTGKCKFGASCKFHHPKEIVIPSSGQETGSGHTETFNTEIRAPITLCLG